MKMSFDFIDSEPTAEPPMSNQWALMAKNPINSVRPRPAKIGVYITVLLRCWPWIAA